KHDIASRSLAGYMEVVRQFPNTRAARDALFTAAVCHERLSSYNNYWSQIYERGGHAGDRLVTYRDVKAAYPNYRFPPRTMGWEPATRSGNGQNAWPPPPKPKPRPSRWKRISKALTGSAVAAVFSAGKSVEEVRRAMVDFIARMWELFRVGFQLSGLLFLL